MPKPGDPVKKPAARKGLEVKYATSVRTCQLVNARRPIICAACQDTGKNSKGGDCHPCKVNGRIK